MLRVAIGSVIDRPAECPEAPPRSTLNANERAVADLWRRNSLERFAVCQSRTSDFHAVLLPTQRKRAKRATPHEHTAALNKAGAGIQAIAHVTMATNPTNRHNRHQGVKMRDKGGIGALDNDSIVPF